MFTILHYFVLIRVNVSINRVVIVIILVMLSLSYISPHSVKTRESKEEQLHIAVHTINSNICDADPLDN